MEFHGENELEKPSHSRPETRDSKLLPADISMTQLEVDNLNFAARPARQNAGRETAIWSSSKP